MKSQPLYIQFPLKKQKQIPTEIIKYKLKKNKQENYTIAMHVATICKQTTSL